MHQCSRNARHPARLAEVTAAAILAAVHTHVPAGSNGVSGPIRCFVAAFLTAESAALLQAALREVVDPRLLGRRVARVVPTGNYHVTLKFLGDTEPAALPAALAAVQALSGHDVSAEVPAVTGFPRARGARLVAAELADHPGLEAWWAALGARLGSEHRPFRPHVTVLRLRRPRTVGRAELSPTLPVTLTAPRLYRSDQADAGVRYSPVVLPA